MMKLETWVEKIQKTLELIVEEKTDTDVDDKHSTIFSSACWISIDNNNNHTLELSFLSGLDGSFCAHIINELYSKINNIKIEIYNNFYFDRKGNVIFGDEADKIYEELNFQHLFEKKIKHLPLVNSPVVGEA